MSRFRFELAAPADDADLRRVLRETPMQGRISVAFSREPSWFQAAAIDGDPRQVIACRDCDSGRIIGFGSRAVRSLYVDGHAERVGYLSSLRLLSKYRNRGLIARGYAYFRKLHADGLVGYYLTTIAAGNTPALAALTGSRAGLPSYIPAGDYRTLALPLRPCRDRSDPSLEIRPAGRDDLGDLLKFIAREGPRRQFFPVMGGAELAGGSGQFLGLRLEDILLARQSEQVVGILGAWDQHAYKQTVVRDYRGVLRWMRPALNAWWSLRGRPRLPAPGAPLRFRIAALPLVQENTPAVFQALLAATLSRWAGGESTHLLLGLHERDPLLAAARRWAAACYTTHLYLVTWTDQKELAARAQSRVPYLELGTL